MPETIYGPPAVAVAWIPYFVNLSRMSPNNFTRHRKRFALDMVFDTGNDPPPAAYADRSDYQRYLATKNHRAAIAIQDVRLIEGKSVPEYRTHFSIGFTPMPFPYSWRLIEGRPAPVKKIRRFFHARGMGMRHDSVAHDGDRKTITAFLQFKLGHLANYIGFCLSGQYAPYAFMSIRYTIHGTKEVEVEFGGSYVPSQAYYVDWNRRGSHDMLGITAQQINGFLGAGDCTVAPVAVHHTALANTVSR